MMLYYCVFINMFLFYCFPVHIYTHIVYICRVLNLTECAECIIQRIQIRFGARKSLLRDDYDDYYCRYYYYYHSRGTPGPFWSCPGLAVS